MRARLRIVAVYGPYLTHQHILTTRVSYRRP